jgi:RND family efflux transporter MFP subunit
MNCHTIPHLRHFIRLAGCFNLALVTCQASAQAASELKAVQSIAVPATLIPVRDRINVAGKVAPADSTEVIASRDMIVSEFLVTPGQQVKKGQNLAKIDAESVARELKYLRPYRDVTARNVKLSEINLEVAKEKLSRTEILASRGIVKETDLDRAKSEEDSARRAYEYSLSQLNENDQRVKEAEQKLKDVALVSPMDGIVAQMAVDPKKVSGIYRTSTGAVIARIEKPHEYVVNLKLSDRDFIALERFPLCEVMLPHQKPVTCQIIPPKGIPERSPTAVAAQFPVDVRFTFKTSQIPMGLETEVRLHAANEQPRLVIPWNAVEVEPGRTFVRKKSNSKFLRQEVKLGWRDGYSVEVTSGLAPGEIVEAKVWPPVRGLP